MEAALAECLLQQAREMWQPSEPSLMEQLLRDNKSTDSE